MHSTGRIIRCDIISNTFPLNFYMACLVQFCTTNEYHCKHILMVFIDLLHKLGVPFASFPPKEEHYPSPLSVRFTRAHQMCTSYQRYLLSVLVDIVYMS